MFKYMFLFVATSLRNVQFAFLSQGALSLRNQFNVVFNRKVSDGWLYFRNSYEKGLSLALDRAADEQWSQHKRGQFSCPGDQDGSDCNKDFWKLSCGFLQTSQPGLLFVEKRKKLYLESEIQHRVFFNDHYPSATPEHQPLQCPFTPTSVSANTVSQVCSTLCPSANWVLSTVSWLQIHSEFALMLSINFLFQTNTLISIHIFNF